MIRFKTFRKALEKIESVSIQKIPDYKEIITAKTACFDFKARKFRFFDENGMELVKFYQNEVSIISRVDTDDSEFKFFISLKNGVEYLMKFNMQENCSFFAVNKCVRENIETVIKSAPTYLCKFNGKRVWIRKSTHHGAFSIWDYNDESDNSAITESFFVENFDYEIKKLSGLAVIDFIDKSNSRIYGKALDVTFIVGDADDVNGVIIGTSSGEYVLKAVD